VTRRSLTRFPRGSGYEYGDAQHLPIVPATEETPTTTSPSVTEQPPAPGDAGQKEKQL